MATLQDAASVALKAVAKMTHRLQGLCSVVLKRCYVADEEKAEQEMNLGTIQSTGVRNRRAPEQTSDTADDHPVSPTTSTESDTLTPSPSEGPEENRGEGVVQGVPTHMSANRSNTYLKILSSKVLGNVFLIGSELVYPFE
jgi:hypothetical protein